MIIESFEKDEIEAFNKVLKGRKVNVLMGVGSFAHAKHCFAFGFPDTMVLIDPAWADEKALGYDISLLEQLKDKDVPLKFIQTSSTVDIVEFYFDGKKKTVHFYKIGYNPSILGRFQPDVFHMGHAVIGDNPEYLSFGPVMESMLLLPKGTIVLNIDTGCTRYILPLKVYANYFFTVACTYVNEDDVRREIKGMEEHNLFSLNIGEGGIEIDERRIRQRYTRNIYKKTRDIDEKENILVYKFAKAFKDFCDCLEERQRMKELEMQAEELRRQGKKIGEVKEIVKHKKDILGLPKTLEALWGVFNTAQKKKLIKLIREFSFKSEKEFVEEAIEILNLE